MEKDQKGLLQFIDIREEKTVISFESKAKYDYNPDACKHNTVICDENLSYLECSKCGEKLEPIHYLYKWAINERNTEYRIAQLREIKEKLKNKIRTKCEHCNKMTRINTP